MKATFQDVHLASPTGFRRIAHPRVEGGARGSGGGGDRLPQGTGLPPPRCSVVTAVRSLEVPPLRIPIKWVYGRAVFLLLGNSDRSKVNGKVDVQFLDLVRGSPQSTPRLLISATHPDEGQPEAAATAQRWRPIGGGRLIGNLLGK